MVSGIGFWAFPSSTVQSLRSAEILQEIVDVASHVPGKVVGRPLSKCNGFQEDIKKRAHIETFKWTTANQIKDTLKLRLWYVKPPILKISQIPIHCTTTDSLSAYLPQRFENLPVRHRCPSSFGYTKAAVFSTQALFLDDSKRLRLLHYMKQVFMHSPIQFIKKIRL